MRTLFFCMLIVTLAVGCRKKPASGENTANKESETKRTELLTLRQQIPGTWVATNLEIEVNSENGSNRNIRLEAGMEDFLPILHLQAWSGTFREDGSFIDVWIGEGENDRQENNGQWSITGDSLQMYYLTPMQRIQKYHVSIQGPVSIFNGYVDWDKDGKKDDRLTGRFDKVIRN